MVFNLTGSFSTVPFPMVRSGFLLSAHIELTSHRLLFFGCVHQGGPARVCVGGATPCKPSIFRFLFDLDRLVGDWTVVTGASCGAPC